MSLVRYRAGPPTGELRHLVAQQHQQAQQTRPKLQAATMLRQELIAGSQSQVTLRQRANTKQAGDSPASGPDNEHQMSYDISAWALIDEQSLSSNLVSQFECQLAIEGTNYEQRQSIGLQRGKYL